MHRIDDGLMGEIRERFAHVESCPFSGPRVFFENAGGALTLKSVVDTSARFAAVPDNQGRRNAASAALMERIAACRADARDFFNAPQGEIILGESGSELLFRLIRVACLGAVEAARGRGEAAGRLLGTTLEHPASRSASRRWAGVAGLDRHLVPHDDATGTVTAEAYAAAVTPDTRVATVIHTSPVTGISVDVAAVVRAIRATAPDCLIVVDGIQHAAHGGLDIESYDIDGYVVSPYKVFSRHGYGLAWMSGRLAALPHEGIDGAPGTPWELGTRDTGAYATFSDVVGYFDWLGGRLTGEEAPRRARLRAAGEAIQAQEQALCQAMLHGTGNLPGLADMPGLTIIGGLDNPGREGLVSFVAAGRPSAEIVDRLEEAGVRVHIRKADHYSGNILDPLGAEDCVRVSMCHYNTLGEVARFLSAMNALTDGAAPG